MQTAWPDPFLLKPMYRGSLIIVLYYAVILAGLTFLPGLVAIALGLATRRAARSYDPAQPSVLGGLCAGLHGLSRKAGVVLLATSCGFLGAGLASVCLNVALLALAMISDRLFPTAGAEVDSTLIGLTYVGLLGLGFLACFAVSLDWLVRRLKPRPA